MQRTPIWFAHYAAAFFLTCVVVAVDVRAEFTSDKATESVQMLLPGLRVHRLPVELTNINNLRYRRDGLLDALGYNGDIWLLCDSDRDGLEDTAKKFFENEGRFRGPIGMAVIPAGHPLLADGLRDGEGQARGAVVTSKGKVSVILDFDGDDIAEQEWIFADGWVEIPQNVDAIGVAIILSTARSILG